SSRSKGNFNAASTTASRRDDETLTSSQRSAEIQEQLSKIRQRETDLAARQDAMQIIFDEIREEQDSVAEVRRRVSGEIAALRDPWVVSQRTAAVEQRTSTSKPALQRDDSRTAFRENPSKSRLTLTVRDSQTVGDMAVLVRRLAEQGSFRAATALLNT